MSTEDIAPDLFLFVASLVALSQPFVARHQHLPATMSTRCRAVEVGKDYSRTPADVSQMAQPIERDDGARACGLNALTMAPLMRAQYY